MPEPRTYVVGLPVILTVHDDGRVDWGIDKGDTVKGVSEEYPSTYDDQNLTQEQVDADLDRIDAAINAEATP